MPLRCKCNASEGEKIMQNKMNIIRVLFFTLMMTTMGLAMAGDPMKGRGIYAERCAGCHGANGKPQIAEVPNFTMGQGLMKSDREIVEYIKKGGGVMPGYEGVLSETEMLDVIAHLRTFF